MRHGIPHPLELADRLAGCGRGTVARCHSLIGPALTGAAPARTCVGVGDTGCRVYSEYLGRSAAIARARDLEELDDLRGAVERAWVRGDLADADRLALLELVALRSAVIASA